MQAERIDSLPITIRRTRGNVFPADMNITATHMTIQKSHTKAKSFDKINLVA